LDSVRLLGIYVYGFAQADSYGYPGGLGFAPNITSAPGSKRVTSEEFSAQSLTAWMEVQFEEIEEDRGLKDDFDGDGVDNMSEFVDFPGRMISNSAPRSAD
jgi:hypothetical protein